MTEQNDSPDKKPPSKDKADQIVSSIFDQKSQRKGIPKILNTQSQPAPPQIKKAKEKRKSFRNPIPPLFSSLIHRKKKYPDISVGIDIGVNSIKMVQLVYEKEKIKISKLTVREFPPMDQATQVSRDNFALNTLYVLLRKEIIQKYDLDKMDVSIYVSISSTKADIQNIKLEGSRQEIEKNIEYELHQRLGKEFDDLSHDYVILNQVKNQKTQKVGVLLVTALKKEILAYLDVFKSVNIPVQTVDIDIFSTINYRIRHKTVQPEEVVIFLDIGGEITKLCVVHNNQLQFTRNISVDGHVLTKSIEKYHSVSYEEAEKMKFSCSAAQPGSQEIQKIKNAIADSLEKLVRDIRHSFKFYSYQVSQSKIEKFDRVILSGGSANLVHKMDYVDTHLKVPVELEDSWKDFEFAGEAESQSTDSSLDSIRFSVAFGLATRGFDRDESRKNQYINLIPSERKIREFSFQNQYAGVCAGVFLCAVLFFFGQMANIQRYSHLVDKGKKESEKLKIQLREFNLALENIQELESSLEEEKKALQQRLGFLREAYKYSASHALVLDNLTRLIPKEAWFNKIHFEDDYVTMSGTTLNNNLISDFMAILDQSSYFKKTVLNFTKRNDEEGSAVINFEIKTRHVPGH